MKFYWRKSNGSQKEKVMYEPHVPPYAWHWGIQAMTQVIETYFYLSSMSKDIHIYVKQCMLCQKVKYKRGKTPSLLQPLPIPNVPLESISIEFIFGLPKCIKGNMGIWTIVDHFSK